MNLLRYSPVLLFLLGATAFAAEPLLTTDRATTLPTTLPAVPVQPPLTSLPVRITLEADDVVFMHGTPDPSLYTAYGATVVAWGGVNNTLAEVRALHDMGIHATGAINTINAEPKDQYSNPDLAEATVRDIEGNPIIVPWKTDRFYQGVPAWWDCTNHPSYRAYLRGRVAAVMNGAPDGLHVDDHLGTANSVYFGGCFCQYCMAGFRQYLQAHSTPQLLAAAKVEDFDSFNYADLVRQYAATRGDYIKKFYTIPLHDEFMDFQLQAAAENVRGLGREAAEIVNHPVTLSANTGLPSLVSLPITPSLSYLVGEVDHLAAKGTASLDNAVLAYRMAEALGKPMASTALGRDWFYVQDRKAENLVKTWIALSYACGAHLMTPVRAYTYSPDKHAGRYDGPPAVFGPLYQFVRANSQLFRGMATVGPLAVPKNIPLVFDTEAQRQAFRATLMEGHPKPLTVGDSVWAFPRAGKTGAVVHLLNLAYDASNDSLAPQKDLSVRLAPDLFGRAFSGCSPQTIGSISLSSRVFSALFAPFLEFPLSGHNLPAGGEGFGQAHLGGLQQDAHRLARLGDLVA